MGGLNICKGVAKSDIEGAWSTARLGAVAILGGSCPSFNLDAVAFSGKCRGLVKQATCYGIKAASTYDVDTVDYGLLAGDVRNIEALGNLASTDVAGCFGQVRDAIQTCMSENANFVQDTIDAAEAAYKKNFEAEVRAFADSNSGSLLGDLASMAMDQFSSAEDIRSFIESHVSEGVVADAEAAGSQALEMAQEWCANDCTSKSTKFLKGIFNHMNGGGCTDASVFCGACAARADSWFGRPKNSLPCCIENVVQRGIEAYDYVVENYSETLSEYAAQLAAGLSDAAVAEAVAAKDRFVEQFNCVRDVYNGNQPDCA